MQVDDVGDDRDRQHQQHCCYSQQMLGPPGTGEPYNKWQELKITLTVNEDFAIVHRKVAIEVPRSHWSAAIPHEERATWDDILMSQILRLVVRGESSRLPAVC
jgi:hypothetical protein